MLEASLNTDAVVQRFETMLTRIEAFGQTEMPQGVTDWQAIDMHRKFPETELDASDPQEVNASTMVYPRSRTYEQTHPHRGHPVATRKTKPLSSMPRLIKSALRHPILRPELFDKFHTRLVAMFYETIKWR
jgi:hypothetical protein